MRRLALLAVFALSACGTPQAGDKCDTSGFLCSGTSAALECKLGSWVLLPCRGATGCLREGDTIKCDMQGNAEGDACASTAEGRGLCTSDNLGTLECREGTLKKTNTCRSCTVVNEQVVCQP